MVGGLGVELVLREIEALEGPKLHDRVYHLVGGESGVDCLSVRKDAAHR